MAENTPNTTAVAPARTRMDAARSIDEAAGNGAIALRPQNFTQAMELSSLLSSSELIPKPLRGKPADVLCIVMAGSELGLSPMQALRGMHVIEGKAITSADLAVALVVSKRDVCKFFRLVESDEQKATYETQRVGDPEPQRLTWTMEMAKRAKLAGKDNWMSYPASMLRARAKLDLARAVFPDLLMGVYEFDEEDDITRSANAKTVQTITVDQPSNLRELGSRMKARRGAMPAAVEADAPVEGEATEATKETQEADADQGAAAAEDDLPMGALQPGDNANRPAVREPAPAREPEPSTAATPTAARQRRF